MADASADHVPVSWSKLLLNLDGDSDDFVGEAWSLLGPLGVLGPEWSDFAGLMGADLSPSAAYGPGEPVFGKAKTLFGGLAKGLSIWGSRVGSYSCFCSSALMLLFLTREAFWCRSIEERRVGVGEPLPYMFSEFRFCQKTRGDVTESAGEDWNGDESLLSVDF